MGSILKELQKCELHNGELIIPGLSDNGLIELSNVLRENLLSYKIPHYKVIGANIVVTSGRQMLDYVSKTKGVSKSYAELISVFRDLVISRVAGYPASLRWANPEELDGFMKQKVFAFATSDGSEISTENNSIIFECSSGQPVKSLIKKVEIIKFNSLASRIDILFYRGTGILDFPKATGIITTMQEQIGVIVPEQAPQYVPISQVYDLTQIFTVRILQPGDTNIKLYYKRDLDESILKQILVDWSVDIEQNEIELEKAVKV